MRITAALYVPVLIGCIGTPAAAQSFSHATFDTVLASYVVDSRVDYAALGADRAPLNRYISQVAAVSAEEFERWPEPEQIAYLINAYNAYTIETILDHYPIKGSGFFKKLTAPKRFAFPSNSIRHIDGVFDRIQHTVAGRQLTLDGIEHETLRVRYNEPRIHFALVCAAVSCPPLRTEAYTGERLDEQLDDQGRAFLNDPRLNRFEPATGLVHLSKIFDWFGEDFRQFAAGSGYTGDERIAGVLAFVSRYLNDPVRSFLEGGDYEVRFLDYDWTLNDQAVAAAAQ